MTANSFSQWFVYTDASYEPSSMTGGLGGVLVNASSEVTAWFGIALDCKTCEQLGPSDKGTIIYELELLAAVVSLILGNGDNDDEPSVHFGDHDGVRFSVIKATSTGVDGELLMEYHLKLETLAGSRTWFARFQQNQTSATFHHVVSFTVCWLTIPMFQQIPEHACQRCWNF